MEGDFGYKYFGKSSRMVGYDSCDRLVPQLGNGISRTREFAYTSQTLDREAKEVTNARDSGKGQGQ